ncbi:MAG: hypothetical protein H0T79_14170, partial [Deltaproteobacteria bacterium]|nr:hypothetical protein [Deltaproteobacteria bacterium]
LRIVGVHERARHGDVVFVQVTNPARRSMRLTQLRYTFAADGATVSTGVVALSREIQPGAAVVVEVPLDAPNGTTPLTMIGELTAELDAIVRIFRVSAQIDPHAAE